MGYGSWNATSYCDYSTSVGRTLDFATGRVDNVNTFVSKKINEGLDPRNFDVRECVNSDEHPNTVPVILALDVTGSMGRACEETAQALGVIVNGLFDKIKDVEFCIMGIGDIECDHAPIQMSQFESDVRIAKSIDDIYREGGGGGNGYESYSAAWYMGLKRTKLDCYDKQNRKGIIITMGDEPLNPFLDKRKLNAFINGSEETEIDTHELYQAASEKFDIYHIAINDSHSSYNFYKSRIEKSFKPLLKERYRVSTINDLAQTIEQCILDSVGYTEESSSTQVNENGEITW